MSGAKVNDFMLQLASRLVEERKVAESTANLYVQVLYRLNGRKPFKTLAFLRDTAAIHEALKEFAPSTQRSSLGAIASALSLVKDKGAYRKTHAHYVAAMAMPVESGGEVEGEGEEKGDSPAPVGGPGAMSEKQAENWVDWQEVQKKKCSLSTAVSSFAGSKRLTAAQYETLLQYVILSLYTDIPPRRNLDYQLLYVVSEPKTDISKNYLNLDDRTFTFNAYKTARTYKAQKVAIPEDLMQTIRLYLRHHPSAPNRITKKTEFRFLVKQDGTPLNSVNSITRVLNKIFDGKHVGSSMLRHIFLTSKYGAEDAARAEDATAMGHSVSQQREYVLQKPAGE